jgi:hypothetical protein
MCRSSSFRLQASATHPISPTRCTAMLNAPIGTSASHVTQNAGSVGQFGNVLIFESLVNSPLHR